MVGSIGAVVKGLWTQLNDLKENVIEVVNEQIDLILEVVLEGFFAITGIDPDKIEEDTPDDRKRKEKMKAELAERSEGAVTKFSAPSADGKPAQAAAGGGQDLPTSENLVKLQKVYKHLLNIVPIEDLLTMAGMTQVVGFIKSTETLERQFLQTWAAQMVPLFGDSAMQYVPADVKPLVADLLEEDVGGGSKIDQFLWKFTLTKKATVKENLARFLTDLFDPDDLKDNVSSFFDTEIDKVLKSDLSFFLSSSAPNSPLAKTWRSTLKTLENTLLSAEAQAQNRYYYVKDKPPTAKETDSDILTLMVDLKLLPDQTDFMKKNKKSQDAIWKKEELLKYITAQAAKVTTDPCMQGTAVVDVIKQITNERITWQSFNFLLLVVSVVDVREATGKMVAETLMVKGFGADGSDIRAVVNGYYYKLNQKNGKHRYVHSVDTYKEDCGKEWKEWIEENIVSEVVYRPGDGWNARAKDKNKKNNAWDLVLTPLGKSKIEAKTPEDGVLYRNRRRAPNDICADGDGWEAMTKEFKPTGQIRHDFDQAKAMMECAKVQLGVKGVKEWDDLTKQAVKVFGELSEWTGLLPIYRCVPAILELCSGGIWKEAACRLLMSKLKIAGEYGAEVLHDRERAAINCLGKERLDDMRGLMFPSDWWITQYPVWDWNFKASDDELSMDECWDMITANTDGFITKTDFFKLVDCFRFVPTNHNDKISFKTIQIDSEADQVGTGDTKPYDWFGGVSFMIEEKSTGDLYWKSSGKWRKFKGLTVEMLEDLLNKYMGYNMAAKSLRVLWTKFNSLPYVSFDELYNGIRDREDQPPLTDEQKLTVKTMCVQEPEGDNPGIYKSFMKFIGTEIVTEESFEALLTEVQITLPEHCVKQIYTSCDEPSVETKFGVIKTLRQGRSVTILCKTEKLRAILENFNADDKYIPEQWEEDFVGQPLAVSSPRFELDVDQVFPLHKKGKPAKSLTLPAMDGTPITYLVEKMQFRKGVLHGSVFTEEEDPVLANNKYEPGRKPLAWFNEVVELKQADEEISSGSAILVMDFTVRSLDGYCGDWRGDAVAVADIKEAVPEYLKQGLWFEALQQLCQDVLGLPYGADVLKEVFEVVDTNQSGFLEPHEFYAMVVKIFKMGMPFTIFQKLVNDIGLRINPKWLQKTFQTMDLDQNQTLSVDEFLSGMDILINDMIPQLVLDKTGLTIPQIIPRILGAVFMLLVIFAFIMMAMQAFTGLGGASSVIQSVLAAGSAGGVKSESGPPNIEKLKRTITELVYSVMEIDKKKVKESEKKKAAGKGGGGDGDKKKE
eukprot:gnl/MRDRNA2_/MRDRNA2_58218_c0_seq1.p1 gnl/MRDRNA2_/MRDRNA2_58218_c0~~gnl/MRDRNA2_/MRDRNA2_58218_c0_seq1.p1  ORF type:complete len:1387 (+),score=342.51 gnl/MRDRNA2_/MRDRNA2_58218_c0_seq1:285-4163(+)